MIKKIHNFKFVIRNCQKGMTYVELIVVLSIFAVMSSIVLFNHGKFQAKVDIKNLANDIALKIVEAQKSAMSGKWNTNAPSGWKPSYGVYFDLSVPNHFIYFADFVDINKQYDAGSGCSTGGGECLDDIEITKGKISKIEECLIGDCSSSASISSSLSITFTRPNSGAVFYDSGGELTGFDYMQITVSSADSSFNGYIKIYPSGRIQVN